MKVVENKSCSLAFIWTRAMSLVVLSSNSNRDTKYAGSDRAIINISYLINGVDFFYF